MPLSKDHKAKTRSAILAAAGALFREHGFDGVGIEEIMAKANLTRGGFYAHFASKADLFAKVLGEEPAFTRMLKERQAPETANAGVAKEAAHNAALDVLATYLDPDNIAYVTSTCPMVSLARDVDKGGTPARQALTHVTTELASLLQTGMSAAHLDQSESRALAILALCVGGVTVARTAADPALAQKMLQACESEARRLMAAR
ncbi:MAG: TetR/AcrR family transcriptional regulator [Rhodospirillaceae bacterium]|nr:TetR/AcrR family transcriptional regulator [Rhodospirillaceae bacterium]